MEAFSIGMNEGETKGKGDILDEEDTPYFDMEVTPKMPCYKTKIFIILISIISIILIGIAAFAFIFIIFLRDSKCDIGNGYYYPEDKTKEKNCLKCDLNCKICHGNISHSQCDTCFDLFLPSFENHKIKFCNKKCEKGDKKPCKECDTTKNKCTACNYGYFMPEDDQRKVDCQKCNVDYCDECSVQKILINVKPVLALISLYMKEMK